MKQLSENLLILEEATSTNSYLMQLVQSSEETIPSLFSVLALNQVEGRGQRGSQWHSKPQEDLTFSFVLRSGGLRPTELYAVSEFAAVGLLKTIARYLDEEQKRRLSIKWPNDIYYGEHKIAGILIENSITGDKIDYSVVGIGLNLNEQHFAPELPNPISLKQITGQSYEPLEVHARLMRRFGFMREDFHLGNYAEVHRLYMHRLYRREGLHNYTDKDGTFKAEIADVLPSGHLVLQREDGSRSTYAFKEVRFDAD